MVTDQAHHIFGFVNDFRSFLIYRQKLLKLTPCFTCRLRDRYLFLNDNTGTTLFDVHCVYHPAWAASIIAKTKPSFHADILSTKHFCSILSAFVPVQCYDYRLAGLELSGLTSESANIASLPFPSGSIGSLSCMHIVEQIGLGRYGDPLVPEIELKAIAELKDAIVLGLKCISNIGR